MADAFFIRAVLAGIGIAIVAGPLGCFIIWRRMAYFGDTMAHSALLGIAFGLLLNINLTIGVFAATVVIAIILFILQRQRSLPVDALLGILAHSSLALGLVLLALMPQIRLDLMAYLFGDILSVQQLDLMIIYVGGAVVLCVLAIIWRALIAATISEDIAGAEDLKPERTKLIFMILIAATIAIAMKIIGILLITSLLIIPAATARRFANGPEHMALLAIIIGIVAVVAGLSGSLQIDTPSGPSIVVAALVVFLLSHIVPQRMFGEGRK